MTAQTDEAQGQINARIAEELSAAVWQVQAAVALLDGGATVPFIARYRKEATGSLDDAQLRMLTERLDYLRELQDRRTAILESIAAQGKLTDALAAQIAAADTKARLEDIYQPYKTKRRTKAQIAREAGLEPLADLLIGNPTPRSVHCRRRFRRGRPRNRRCGAGPRRCSGHPGREIRRGRRSGRGVARDVVAARPVDLGIARRARPRTPPSSPTTSTSPSR